ncbi:hypothetical protein Pelo_7550 [Pelomyxa schiedti]|nr:hypothetical protein Pelo_7550 [Pelomyxa schiedti]
MQWGSLLFNPQNTGPPPQTIALDMLSFTLFEVGAPQARDEVLLKCMTHLTLWDLSAVAPFVSRRWRRCSYNATPWRVEAEKRGISLKPGVGEFSPGVWREAFLENIVAEYHDNGLLLTRAVAKLERLVSLSGCSLPVAMNASWRQLIRDRYCVTELNSRSAHDRYQWHLWGDADLCIYRFTPECTVSFEVTPIPNNGVLNLSIKLLTLSDVCALAILITHRRIFTTNPSLTQIMESLSLSSITTQYRTKSDILSRFGEETAEIERKKALMAAYQVDTTKNKSKKKSLVWLAHQQVTEEAPEHGMNDLIYGVLQGTGAVVDDGNTLVLVSQTSRYFYIFYFCTS